MRRPDPSEDHELTDEEMSTRRGIASDVEFSVRAFPCPSLVAKWRNFLLVPFQLWTENPVPTVATAMPMGDSVGRPNKLERH